MSMNDKLNDEINTDIIYMALYKRPTVEMLRIETLDIPIICTAQLLTHHGFLIHTILEDVISSFPK